MRLDQQIVEVLEEPFSNRDTAGLTLLTDKGEYGGALPQCGNNAQRTDIAARMRLGWVCVQFLTRELN